MGDNMVFMALLTHQKNYKPVLRDEMVLQHILRL